jgi:Psb28 protein
VLDGHLSECAGHSLLIFTNITPAGAIAQAKFVNGKPDRIEARYIMRSSLEWDRFMVSRSTLCCACKYMLYVQYADLECECPV